MLFQVSWIRHEDVQILAVGGQTFTSDSRFLSVKRYLERTILYLKSQ